MSNTRPEPTYESYRGDDGRLQTLYTINDLLRQVVADGLDMDEILPGVLHLALQELRASSGSIIVVNEQLQLQHAWLINEEGPEESNAPFLQTVVEKGLFGWATRRKETVVVDDTRTDERWLPRPNHPTALEPWSAVCTPLIVRSRPVGAITMTCPGPDQFGPREVELLEAIAGQAATTIESARLYRESQQRANALAALVSAAATVSTSLEQNQVLRGVAEQMLALLRTEVCIIYDWDEQSRTLTKRLVYPAAATQADSLFQGGIWFTAEQFPVVAQVLENSEAIQVNPRESLSGREEQIMMKEGEIEAVLLLPLVVRDQAIGLLALLDLTDRRHFSDSEVSFARMLANQAAIAMQNARLYEDTQHQLRVSALLNDASKVINSTLDTGQILQSLLAQMNELLNAEAISIALVDSQHNELVYTVAEGIGSEEIVGLRLPSNQGVSGWAMEHGLPALVPDTSQDPRFYVEGDRRTGHNTRAMICAPLQVKGEVLGTIQAINPKKGPFTEGDLQLLVNLANLASSALNNARQFARTQAAEERYLSLFEDSINPILLTDPHGNIVEANRRACEFVGYDYAELLRLPIFSLHAIGDAGDSLPVLDKIPDETAVNFVSELLTHDGHSIPVEGYVKRTLSAGTELLQWIYRDITQQLELEEMRGDLMAMLVHDLQSPLGNVISSLELMRYELPANGDPILSSIVDIAVRSSNRLQTLIRSLLDISHLEAGRPLANLAFANLTTLIDEAAEVVQPTLERRHAELTRRLPATLPLVYVDADMVRRVLVNLLDNASKYTPEGQRVTVTVSEVDAAGRLLVSVSDQGKGIPARYREVIFDKFRRLQGENAPKGMGLGLAFCRLAVEAHGGTIWVDDAPGSGARFNFSLPTRAFDPLRLGS